MLPNTKQCRKCRRVKSFLEFSYSAKSSDGLQSYCKDCNRLSVNLRNKQNPRQHKNRNLKTKYGIDHFQFDIKLAAQNNCCGLCNKPFTLENSPVVDHDHKTGLIRGLLCYRCNKGIGVFRDDHQRLRNAASYVASNWSTHEWCVPEAYKHGVRRRHRKRKV